MLAQLVERLTDRAVRLLTLTGPGGTGKSRLAIELAEQVCETFEDGVHFVDLAPLSDPGTVLTTIARTLHFEQSAPSSDTEGCVELFGARHVLLVLDNFEHLITAAPAIAQLLASCRKLKIIVTSREALQLRWEHVVRVPPLDVPDLQVLPGIGALIRVPAVRLFVDRPRQVNPGFTLTERTAELVARLCVHLDGLPLSIELAAARTRALGLEAVFDRLMERLDVLAGGAHDQPARHRTLHAAINWSYELMSPREQLVFGRLAVFTGTWSLAAAEAVCAADDIQAEEVRAIIERLVERSLVQVEESAGLARFRFLETVRQFAMERLEVSGELSWCRRQHLQWYVVVANGIRPELLRGEDVELLEHDYNNLRSALSTAIIAADGEAALGLGRGLWLLLHPVRLRVVHAMSGGRTRTTSELCARLPDVSKATVYRHVALLVEGGLLEVAGEQRVHGAVERCYRLHQARAVIDRESVASMSLEEHRHGFAAAMAGLVAEFNTYLDREHADPTADLVGYRQIPLWLNQHELAELISEIRSLIVSKMENEPTLDRSLHLLSPFVFPIETSQQHQSDKQVS